MEKKNQKEEAIRFLSILAKHYDLQDRTGMWGDIQNVVTKSIAKLGGSPDLLRLVNDCLDGVKANAALTTACPAVLQIVETFESRDNDWCSSFVTALSQHIRAWTPLARKRYNETKEGKVQL